MIMKRALTTLFGLCFSLSVIFAQEEPVTFTVTRLEDGYCCKSSRCFKPSRKVGENIYDVFLELYRFDGPRSGAMPLGISIFTSGDESVVAIARLGNEGKIEGKYVKKNATIRFVDGTSVQVTGTLYDSTKESLKRSTTVGGFYFSFICNEPVSMLTKMRQSDIRSISIENYVVEMAVTEVETAAIINGLCLELMKTIGSSTTFGRGPVDESLFSGEQLFDKAMDYYDAKNYNKAFEYFVKAGQKGNPDAQHAVGHCYYNAKGVTQDRAKAVEWFRKAADNGHVRAQYELGICYSKGHGTAKDDCNAFTWYAKAAEGGNPGAQRELASCYKNGEGTQKDESLAFYWFMKAAQQGDELSQFWVGYSYYYGTGVEESYPNAYEWFLKSANQNDSVSEWYVATMLLDGLGVGKDISKGMSWLTQAAKHGDSRAQYYLARIYMDGNYGQTVDNTQGIYWLKKAAEQNYSDAQNTLGYCYENGLGVLPDLTAAFNLYKKAAENGNKYAIHNLGEFYYFGRGVAKDVARAREYWQKSASMGVKESEEFLEKYH